MTSLAVVCWLWDGPRGYKPAHVNALRLMFAQYLKASHRFVCITDSTEGFDAGVEVVPTPPEARELAGIVSPEGVNMPSCYRRLWIFSKAARAIADRVLLVDIDVVLTGDITHLVKRREKFVGWRPIFSWGNQDRVAGGMYLLRTGAHHEVFDDFCAAGIARAREAGFRGSDQAWISYKLGRKAALWRPSDGIYALSDFELTAHPIRDARCIQFAGIVKPWHREAPDWVKNYYPGAPFMNYTDNDFRRLIRKHAGKRIAVLGGAPTLAAELADVRADIWISVNDHGAKLRRVDYVVAMDEEHCDLKQDMRTLIRAHTDAPIIGPWPHNDFQLSEWPEQPRKGLSGMVAVWVAWAMGGHPVILAGFDAYGGTRVGEGHRMAKFIPGNVRVMGGPLTEVWPKYRKNERLGAYVEHSSIQGLLGIDGQITVRVVKPTVVRGMERAAGTELRVMRHEAARLLKHRMLVEV